MGPRLLLVALLAFGIVVSGAITTTSAASYQLDVPGSVDVPDRTVSFQGSEYTIHAIAREDSSDTLNVQATAPSGVSYRVYLYDTNQHILDSQRATGSAEVTFNLDGLAPGSYMLSLEDGDYRAVHPVVVRGYSVTHDGPTEASPDDRIDVTVEVNPTAASGQPHGVEVIVANDIQTVRTTATHQGNGHYEATVNLAGLEPGSYKLYAVAQGSEEAFGQQELLGLSGAQQLEIRQADTPTLTTIPSAETTPTTTSTTQTPTTSPPPTSTKSTPPSTTELSPQSTTTSSNVITPGPTTERPTEHTTSSPGQHASPLTAVVSTVLVGSYLVYRRSSRGNRPN